MDVQMFNSNGHSLIFKNINSKSYRGAFIPGSTLLQSNSAGAIITLQQSKSILYTISYRIIQILSKLRLTVNEPAGFRLEALISGEMHILVDGRKTKFRAGEYRITDVPLFTALFKKPNACSIFLSYYSNDILEKMGISITACIPQQMPFRMSNMINELLKNPYSDRLRDFYYENCIRELLFFHLARNNKPLPVLLTDKDIDLIYRADTIITSNLQKHYTISELARKLNTNILKLKSGFKNIFGMGVFERLLYRRMEHAKLLLETTDKPINEIAGLAGYDTVAGFIHAFRRMFKVTPREWRGKERRTDNDNSLI